VFPSLLSALDLLFPQAVARADREGLDHVFLVVVEAGPRQPALGDEVLGVFEMVVGTVDRELGN
jgi:hypothetical protein